MTLTRIPIQIPLIVMLNGRMRRSISMKASATSAAEKTRYIPHSMVKPNL
jgi:hypothetical protein